jgi:hypothetical protein
VPVGLQGPKTMKAFKAMLHNCCRSSLSLLHELASFCPLPLTTGVTSLQPSVFSALTSRTQPPLHARLAESSVGSLRLWALLAAARHHESANSGRALTAAATGQQRRGKTHFSPCLPVSSSGSFRGLPRPPGDDVLVDVAFELDIAALRLGLAGRLGDDDTGAREAQLHGRSRHHAH